MQENNFEKSVIFLSKGLAKIEKMRYNSIIKACGNSPPEIF